MTAILDRIPDQETNRVTTSVMPEWVEPMHATLVDTPFSDTEWLFERKLDGVRCLAFCAAGRVDIYTRNRKRRDSHFPEVVEALEAAALDECVLDGEVTAFHKGVSSFSRLQERIGIGDPDAARNSGALLLGYYERDELRYAGRVGTGFDEATLAGLRRLMDKRERRRSPFSEGIDGDDVHWVTPELVGEVAFTEWTDDGRLRHPRFIGLRDDKPARRVVRERPS